MQERLTKARTPISRANRFFGSPIGARGAEGPIVRPTLLEVQERSVLAALACWRPGCWQTHRGRVALQGRVPSEPQASFSSTGPKGQIILECLHGPEGPFFHGCAGST